MSERSVKKLSWDLVVKVSQESILQPTRSGMEELEHSHAKGGGEEHHRQLRELLIRKGEKREDKWEMKEGASNWGLRVPSGSQG